MRFHRPPRRRFETLHEVPHRPGAGNLGPDRRTASRVAFFALGGNNATGGGDCASHIDARSPRNIGKAPREGPFRQRACKPDPVASGHLSRRGLRPAGAAERLLRPTWTSPSRVDDPAWPCTGRGLPGRRVTATPVRSYRTISPLPVRDSRVVAPSAVCFCGTFPRVSPGGSYPPPCSVVSGLSSREGVFSPPRPLGPPEDGSRAKRPQGRAGQGRRKRGVLCT